MRKLLPQVFAGRRSFTDGSGERAVAVRLRMLVAEARRLPRAQLALVTQPDWF